MINSFIGNKQKIINFGLMIFIIIISTASRFYVLRDYPFTNVGDELRDSGLIGMMFYLGKGNDFFGWGYNNSFGSSISLITVPFFFVFGFSSLVYRVPAAFLSVVEIVIVYFLVKSIAGRKAGLMSACLLISLPLHLHYSRTELVVYLSSFMVSALLFPFHLYTKHKNKLSIALGGLLIGIGFGFYVSLRSFLFLAIFFYSFYMTQPPYIKTSV